MITLLFQCNLQAKDITIYVQADHQPNIHFWGYPEEESEWPGVLLTETATVKALDGTEMSFYYKTFTNLAEDAKISFLFNYNGYDDNTRNINNISNSRYYIYKGNHEYEDITSQITGEPDDVIEKVQLPGDFCGWNGDANTFEASEGKYTYVRIVDFSDVTSDIVTFKLLVNNGHWLGWNDIVVNAPDGWVQEAAADGNIQLNLSAIGAKKFTFTAVWGGGNMSSAAWVLNINAEADAIIEKVQLPGNFNEWNGNYAVLMKEGSYTYTCDLDLSSVTEPCVVFKLLVNNRHWLGYYDLVDVEAPDGWAEESIEGGNIQLNLTSTNTKKFTITASWAGGNIASAGWILKISAQGSTGISTGVAFNNAAATPVYDLAGHKMTAARHHKGVCIKDGKKIIMN
ncbi:MAG: hypothetical protein J5486_06870 [Bacteroidaceae bacterium]|nr:hypothetical protein [Bacteroidaceae bacterium]